MAKNGSFLKMKRELDSTPLKFLFRKLNLKYIFEYGKQYLINQRQICWQSDHFK